MRVRRPGSKPLLVLRSLSLAVPPNRCRPYLTVGASPPLSAGYDENGFENGKGKETPPCKQRVDKAVAYLIIITFAILLLMSTVLGIVSILVLVIIPTLGLLSLMFTIIFGALFAKVIKFSFNKCGLNEKVSPITKLECGLVALVGAVGALSDISSTLVGFFLNDYDVGLSIAITCRSYFSYQAFMFAEVPGWINPNFWVDIQLGTALGNYKIAVYLSAGLPAAASGIQYLVKFLNWAYKKRKSGVMVGVAP